MTIQLDPNRIRPSAGGASRRQPPPNRIRPSAGGASGANRRRAQNDESVVVPTRADENYVPAPESLMTLINSALQPFAAACAGTAAPSSIYWCDSFVIPAKAGIQSL